MAKWGSANWPTMVQLNFLNNFHKKSKLKGGQFYEKYSHHKYFGPHIVGHFGHIGGSANQPRAEFSNFKIFRTISYTKSEFKGRSIKKNCQLMYLRPHFAGCFEKWGVCRSAQNWPIKKIFNFISHKIRIKRGSVL